MLRTCFEQAPCVLSATLCQQLSVCPDSNHSRAGATGQDQAHTICRQLQLLLPAAHCWLDVDHLDDIGALEENVMQALTILVFLSRGYFKSATDTNTRLARVTLALGLTL
jgi:hypothetical protein